MQEEMLDNSTTMEENRGTPTRVRRGRGGLRLRLSLRLRLG